MKRERPLIAYMVERVGPYHLARLSHATSAMHLHVVQSYKKDSTYQWQITEECDMPFPCTTLADTPSSHPPRATTSRVASCLSRLQPDVVCVNGWGSRHSLAATRWCLNTRTPYVVMSDSNITDSPQRVSRNLIKTAIVKSSSALFVAGKSASEYAQFLGARPPTIFTGYDVVDNSYFNTAAKQARQKTPPTRSERPYFLAVARLVEKKNLPALIEAYARYRSNVERPNDLVIVGGGQQDEILEQLIKKLRLDQCVEMTGFKQYNEVPSYYGHAVAVVVPSLHEQWGLVINESMACGTPVLASTTCGATHDLLEHGKNGLVFEPTLTGISEALLQYHNLSEDQKAEFADNAELTSKQFGLSLFTDRLKEATDHALTNPCPRKPHLTSILLALTQLAYHP